MDHRIPKSESEWWAHVEIERLERELVLAREHILRLEVAGDSMHRWIFDETGTVHIIPMGKWCEAKQAKP